MKSRAVTQADDKAWLVFRTGPQTGTQYLLESPILRIGRHPGNDLVPQGERTSIVSSNHAEIRKDVGTYRLIDLESTNGTFVDGMRVQEIELESGSIITLGRKGPEFVFLRGQTVGEPVTETMLISDLDDSDAGTESPAPESRFSGKQELLLREAVEKARVARQGGASGQTVFIMREMLFDAVSQTRRRLKAVILVLAFILVSVSLYSVWTIQELREQKSQVDDQLDQIEVALAEAEDPEQINTLLESLELYQEQAREIQKNLLYRLGVRSEQRDLVEEGIRVLMSELGAEQYRIPPEFKERVEFHIQCYQGRDRRNVERALVERRPDLEKIRQRLNEANLPPDLALIVLVESAFRWRKVSSAGAAGPWQLVPETARSLGLEVNEQVDERFDVEKSTEAASRYIKSLILEFGAGGSVMLALAAYNLGPTRVRRIVRRVDDPIKQRNFWYLYRAKALPAETREYVPKIVAAILIGRSPEQFGFDYPALS